MHLGVLAGPVVWGNVEYYVTYVYPLSIYRFEDDLSHGYVVKAYGDVTILSGRITPTMEGSVALFAQFTKTDVNAGVEGICYRGIVNIYREPFSFEGGGTVGVFGLSGSLAFDICEPAPVAPARAPVIEPKLEPMSFK